ncbi:MAG: peptidylprolyl isomerase [Candidatus Cloacimonas sp.]|jgi:parvulin-like peptidyl-prolyl isomerase|nr:peptidylprolyl isomerase [Candidatus Cloacimonas sp.]
MQIIAKVFEIEISTRDLDRECSKIQDLELIFGRKSALKRLIDRCLLYVKAVESGIHVSDLEYENAMLELIEQEEPLGLSSEIVKELSAGELEMLIRRQIMVKKFVKSLCPQDIPISSQKLQEFYEESKEIFQSSERVRCSHILVSNKNGDAKNKAVKLRELIHSAADFNSYSKVCSDCPSNASCGDLGWFHKGKMIPEIDLVAFSMQKGEISQPFSSDYGYHILMLTDRKDFQTIPFDDIKDSLYARLQQIEKEYIISRMVKDLREQYASKITILLPELT